MLCMNEVIRSTSTPFVSRNLKLPFLSRINGMSVVPKTLHFHVKKRLCFLCFHGNEDTPRACPSSSHNIEHRKCLVLREITLK